MSVTTVILDVDGTLIDTNYLHVEAWAQALCAVGQTQPRSVIHRHIGKGGDQFLPTFLDDEGLRAKADAIHGEVYGKLQKQAYPLPGARELLRALDERGLKLWIASSAKPDELERHLDLLEARKRIDGMVTKADVKRSKPAPDVFLRTLERSKARPDEAVVLGDTPWDLAAAQGAGLRAACVLTGGAWTRDELLHKGAAQVFADCLDALKAGFPA